MGQSNKDYLCTIINNLREPQESNQELIKRISQSSETISMLSEMLPDLHGESVIQIINNPEFYESL